MHKRRAAMEGENMAKQTGWAWMSDDGWKTWKRV